MIGMNRVSKVWLYGTPVNMQVSFDGLANLVASKMHKDSLSGNYFVFLSRNRRRIKVLQWDGTGFCIYYKRLEKGQFVAPWLAGQGGNSIRLTVNELLLLLEGSEWVGRVSLSPEPLVLNRTPSPPPPA